MISEALGTVLLFGLLVLFIGIPVYFICKTPYGSDLIPESSTDYSKA
jgi:hypothetical protein